MLISRPLLRMARAELAAVLTVATLIVLATGAALASAVLVGLAVAHAYDGSAGADSAGLLTAALVLVVARACLLWARDVVRARLGGRVAGRSRSAILDRTMEVGPSITTSHRPGSIVSATVDGADTAQAYITLYVPQLLATVVATVAAVATLAWFDPVTAAVTATGLVALPVVQQLWKKRTARRGRTHWEALHAYADQVDDALHGMDTLAALGATERHGQRLRAAADRVARTATADLRTSLFVWVLTTGALGLATAGATAVVAVRAGSGAIGAAAAVATLIVLPEGARPWAELQDAWHEGFNGMFAGQRIRAILNTRRPVVEQPTALPQPLPGAPAVSVADVSVSFDGKPALDHVSLEVPAGQTLAIVGRSGAGKSTLLQLLMRHRDPDGGTVRVAGHDLRDLPLTQVRGMVGWVSQHVALFDSTARENIALARPDATESEVHAAATAAQLLVPADRGGLARGLDTQVSERGSALSGGQRQRVAIARVLLRNAPIVVLDEATSALDSVNEDAVTAALAEAVSGRTVIVVAHRLSTVADADRVAVLHQGRVVECGPPGELMRAGGPWAALVEAQVPAVSADAKGKH